MKCSEDNCEKNVRSRGLCATHYNRLRREGGLPSSRPCIEVNCDLVATAKGYCWKHYRQARRDGVIVGGNICTTHPCTKPQEAYGVCATHYAMRRRRGDLPGQLDCEVKTCDRKEYAKGLCHTHLKRQQAGKPLEPKIAKRAPGEWGEWRVNNHGYVVRYRTENGKSVFQSQHRKVVEDAIGRRLTPDESVHHLNGVRTDNRIENLELWSKSQPAGQRVEDKVLWAEEILRKYDPAKLKEG